MPAAGGDRDLHACGDGAVYFADRQWRVCVNDDGVPVQCNDSGDGQYSSLTCKFGDLLFELRDDGRRIDDCRSDVCHGSVV